ncbi:hypothetical protein [Haladaptatus pallidirubidus]|uniref:hypothetical protein n=1 Tax=Haladaptatus pallidirubidus TaxID=1008152 RepID=UPI001D1177DE|nr:hypothetical protein [Haladaptatus pallidirubidus]
MIVIPRYAGFVSVWDDIIVPESPTKVMRGITVLSPIHSVVSNSTDDTDGNHRCEACGATFDTEDELRKHVHEQGLVD